MAQLGYRILHWFLVSLAQAKPRSLEWPTNSSVTGPTAPHKFFLDDPHPHLLCSGHTGLLAVPHYSQTCLCCGVSSQQVPFARLLLPLIHTRVTPSPSSLAQ